MTVLTRTQIRDLADQVRDGATGKTRAAFIALARANGFEGRPGGWIHRRHTSLNYGQGWAALAAHVWAGMVKLYDVDGAHEQAIEDHAYWLADEHRDAGGIVSGSTYRALREGRYGDAIAWLTGARRSDFRNDNRQPSGDYDRAYPTDDGEAQGAVGAFAAAGMFDSGSAPYFPGAYLVPPTLGGGRAPVYRAEMDRWHGLAVDGHRERAHGVALRIDRRFSHAGR